MDWDDSVFCSLHRPGLFPGLKSNGKVLSAPSLYLSPEGCLGVMDRGDRFDQHRRSEGQCLSMLVDLHLLLLRRCREFSHFVGFGYQCLDAGYKHLPSPMVKPASNDRSYDSAQCSINRNENFRSRSRGLPSS